MRALSADGYNPLAFQCGEGRCYNDVHRMRVEVFAECFDGRNAFSDADGPGVWHWIERHGRLLCVEHKPTPVDPNEWRGQSIAFSRLTAGCNRLIVFMVLAIPDVRTMEVTHYSRYLDGVWSGWRPSSLADVKNSMHAWEAWAAKQANERMIEIARDQMKPAKGAQAFDADDWRQNAIDAALKECPQEFRNQLFERLKRENREALGIYAGTPLGRTAVE